MGLATKDTLFQESYPWQVSSSVDRSTTFRWRVGGKPKKRSLGGSNYQIAREKQRQFESAQAQGHDNPLPTRTPIGQVLETYVQHVRAKKTEKSAQTDVYYLREAFGPCCEALTMTGRRPSAKTRKKPSHTSKLDRRKTLPIIEAQAFELITAAQISDFIDFKVRDQGLKPKTGKNRAVPISSALRPYLDRYTPPATADDAPTPGVGGSQAWYFPSPEGSLWDPDNFSGRHLYKANHDANLPWSCLDLRHTFGSQLAQKGVSLYKIATLMGNSPDIDKLQTVHGSSTFELDYNYISGGVNDGWIDHVTASETINSTTTAIRRLRYLYYDGTTETGYGLAGDLKAAALQQPTGNPAPNDREDIGVSYYRYYVQAFQIETGGFMHGLRYVVGPSTYADLIQAGQDPLAGVPSGRDLVPEYADMTFVYDGIRRVAREITRNCPACSSGGGTGSSGTTLTRSRNPNYPTGTTDDVRSNVWMWKVVENSGRGYDKTVYTNRTARVRRPQSNGVVERFHRTLLDEHFRVEGRRTWFETVDEMQATLDAYLVVYNEQRPHQGRGMNGRTPAKAFLDGRPKSTTAKETKPRPLDTEQAAA